MSSVYTVWVCGVPFSSSLFGSSYVWDNVTGTVPLASPNRLQYKYVGICCRLQHDEGPDRRNASFSVVITDTLAQWWETWSLFSTPRDVFVSCFSHHLCLMAPHGTAFRVWIHGRTHSAIRCMTQWSGSQLTLGRRSPFLGTQQYTLAVITCPCARAENGRVNAV